MSNLQITFKLYKNSHSELDNLDYKNGVLGNFLIQEINFEVSQIAQFLAKSDVISVSAKHKVGLSLFVESNTYLTHIDLTNFLRISWVTI